MPSWDPDVYERFKSYRDRPAIDLLLQIPGDLQPDEIWDLGCGTGEHAAVLARRHPAARVHGLDSSADMLARARARGDGVDWVHGDIEQFNAPHPSPDLIFSNAALQWVAGHETIFPRLASKLSQGGVLACQMPAAHAADWYAAIGELARESAWSDRLARVQGPRPVAAPDQYYAWLSPACRQIDIWTTTYLHALEGEDPVVEWVSGTTLRPFLDALKDPAERSGFLADYRERVRRLVPRRADGTTLLAFQRLFIVARR